MNLYLISQKENNGWDTYDSAVVCAPNTNTARNMYPGNGASLDKDSHYTWVTDPEKVHCVLLGEAGDRVEYGVICASFKAG